MSVAMKSLQRSLIWLAPIALSCILLGSAHAINIQLTSVATGFTEPLYLTHAGDGSGRRFVAQHAGRIRIIDSGGTVLATDFLNLGVTVGPNIGLARCTNASGGDERGLLGLAFHPNYISNGYFYVSYTRASDGASIIARYSVSGNPDVASTTETIILGPIVQPQTNHNGGWMSFGPDGYLYIGIGDGGGAGDDDAGHNVSIGNGQDTTTLLGKILRIDVDNPQAPNNYGIPATNPYAASVGSERKEIFAYGLRNPWRSGFDRGTGRLFSGDVGQGAREEIDIIVNGGNYGWRITEGNICHNPSSGCSFAGLVAPIFDYPHSFGNLSVTGGYVYRGPSYPAIAGLYFYADYSSGRIWTLQETAPGVFGNNTQRRDETFTISSFGEDEAGEVYVCGFNNGNIYRITDTDPQPSPTTSPTASPSPTPSPTPSSSATRSPSPSPTASSTPLPTFSASPTPNAAKNWEAFE